jgi:cytochrome c553
VRARPGSIRSFAACGLLFAAAWASAAPAAVHRGDATAGGAKADDERCIECHVPRDPATAQPGDGLHALLDGQSGPYLAKQMSDYRSGAREHAVMTLVSRNLDDGDLADILAWYAARRWRAGDGVSADAAALRLYAEGDPARGIVACATCHGSPGQPPASADMPRIAGQDAAYLKAQLQHWRSGDRSNSVGGQMTISARALTDIEIQALATGIAAMK